MIDGGLYRYTPTRWPDLAAGLLDELHIHLVPVLLRSGVRLFDRLEPGLTRLERVRFFDGPGATHPKYRLSK